MRWRQPVSLSAARCTTWNGSITARAARQHVGGGGAVAGEPVHRHDLDPAAEVGVLGVEPALEDLSGSTGHHVEQPRWAGAVDDRSQVDQDRHEVRFALAAAVFPLVLIDPEVADPVEVNG
ncbi:hypothetical protein MALGJ_34410 [Mycolicibacter algericus]|uniref:Uncharacterized protein n=1 Tax=Mycolicibacter algericus TaxID=1288388 RepID=A0A7I9YDI8_MYCAL|nr:hypothetical protein MALGJ_34410 [Mycolicibacter algericus]